MHGSRRQHTTRGLPRRPDVDNSSDVRPSPLSAASIESNHEAFRRRGVVTPLLRGSEPVRGAGTHSQTRRTSRGVEDIPGEASASARARRSGQSDRGPRRRGTFSPGLPRRSPFSTSYRPLTAPNLRSGARRFDSKESSPPHRNSAVPPAESPRSWPTPKKPGAHHCRGSLLQILLQPWTFRHSERS